MEITKTDGHGGSAPPSPHGDSALPGSHGGPALPDSRATSPRGIGPLKAKARAAAIRRREAVYAAQAGARLYAAFPKLARRGAVVAGYWPLRQEIDVRPLLARLRAHGCVIALPVVLAPHRPLLFRVWRTGTRLETGAYGTRHPGTTAATVVPDLVLVPLLAFDRAGFRLGYGGGYYDRTLAALRRRRKVLALGIAFAGQAVAAVPRDRFDQPLDGIVTERGQFRIKRHKS